MLSMITNYLWNRPHHFKRKPEVVTDERDITGHIVIVTGANRGNGWQTALELAKRGARVVMACRDLESAEVAKKLILEEVPEGKLVIIKLDLGNLRSVREFSDLVHQRFSHIDMLINNAGIYKFTKKLEKTKDGFEQHMGINHFGPFLLTVLLLDLLKAAKRSRIVILSSLYHQLADLDVNNLNLDGVINPSIFLPYSNSKLANILFVRELSRRLGEDSSITVYALCPGLVHKFKTEEQNLIMKSALWFFQYFAVFDLKEGVSTILHCALSKSLEFESGKMYRFLDIWDLSIDDSLSLRLWEKSEQLVGVKF